jgi:hypothetical protein
LEAAGQDDGKAIRCDQLSPLIGCAKHRILAHFDDVIEIQRKDVLRCQGSRVLANERSRFRQWKPTDSQIFNDSIRGHQLWLTLLN